MGAAITVEEKPLDDVDAPTCLFDFVGKVPILSLFSVEKSQSFVLAGKVPKFRVRSSSVVPVRRKTISRQKCRSMVILWCGSLEDSACFPGQISKSPNPLRFRYEG